MSVLWALTGDARVLEVHDEAVRVALAHVERFGATTRLRVNGGRIHPDTGGLTVATFRQSTSRADDPQIHTHSVISAKVQTADGRWWALDARFLKKHQRMLGGLYQTALRAGMMERLGVVWGPVVHGQADIAGVPDDLIGRMSKRTIQVEDALTVKVEVFRRREGRDPSRRERAAMSREAALDTRTAKTGLAVNDLQTRWRHEAAELGWTGQQLMDAIAVNRRDRQPEPVVTVNAIIDQLSASGSTWGRADVVRTVCDLQPGRAMTATRWAEVVERATDRVLEACVNLDPYGPHLRCRVGDGRSVWIEPVATQYSSEAILTQEEHVLTWVYDRQDDEPTLSLTVQVDGLDLDQVDAARAVAGENRLVVVEGPAGTGKTTMLSAAVTDLTNHGRAVFGVAPTAKAARVLEAETRMPTDTVAKLLFEHSRPDRGPGDRYRLAAATTLVIDEAGMIGTATLDQLTALSDRWGWRVVLAGDPHQLQAVGRGGLFAEICASARVQELGVVHRFTERWEQAASLKLRHGHLDVLDDYEQHGRITPGSFEEHLDRIADEWVAHHQAGRSVAVTATTNTEVDHINHAIQHVRLDARQLDPDRAVGIAGGEQAHVGELVVTRRNDRTLTTDTREIVRNRDRWIVTAVRPDGSIAVTQHDGHGQTILPASYVAEHVRLGYAATEHGNQGDTVDIAYQLVSTATTRRGLYVGATRGRDANQFLVIADTSQETRERLEQVLWSDRADLPAVTQRRGLATALPEPHRTPLPPVVYVEDVEWLTAFRQRLVVQHAQSQERTDDYHQRRQNALDQLDILTPLLDQARQDWVPYQRQLDTLKGELTGRQSDHWEANGRLRHARLRQRRTAQRGVDDNATALQAVQAKIDSVEHAGADVKARKLELEATVRTLHEKTRVSIIEHWDVDHHDDIGHMIDAVDAWHDWNTGRAVTHETLTDALTTLRGAVRRAPIVAFDDETITATNYLQLVNPLRHWMRERGINPRERAIEREIELGIDL